MKDDYQYQQLPLNPKNEGPFGFGRILPTGFNSGASVTGEGGSPPQGAPTGAPNPDGQTPQGGGGAGGGLPAGYGGALLRHDGSAWVAIGPSLSKGILINNSESYYWLSGVEQGDMIYYNGENWIRLQAPQQGTHVLGVIDGQITYIPTEECF